MAKAHPIPTDPRFQNLTGRVFDRLTVLAYVGKDKWGHSMWRCRCSCKRLVILNTQRLNSGHSTACGRHKKNTRNNVKHGGWNTPEWKVWLGMNRRCTDQNSASFDRYGGAGVTVCERWRDSFPNFLADMGAKPTAAHTIDRIDNTKGYSPDNCRWATKAEQATNRKTTRFVTFQGRTLPLKYWAKEIGISDIGLAWRLKRWPIERALTKR